MIKKLLESSNLGKLKIMEMCSFDRSEDLEAAWSNKSLSEKFLN